MTTVKMRPSLCGFKLSLVAALVASQNGNYSIAPSSFSPRIALYTGPVESPVFRGERVFEFSDVPTAAIQGVHKGLPSKDQFFEANPTIIPAWQATASAMLDDTVDGQSSVGSINASYRIDQIDAQLRWHTPIENYIDVTFGIYDSEDSQGRIDEITLKYVPDDLVETIRSNFEDTKQNAASERAEIAKAAKAIRDLVQGVGYEGAKSALLQRIRQSQERLRQTQQQLATMEKTIVFPMSQLFAETGVAAAIGNLVVGVFGTLTTQTYLFADYEVSELESTDMPAMLRYFATMRAEA